jgi:serine phosphatase RsbU (regulator of sigma subunit)
MIRRYEWMLITLLAVVSCLLVFREAPAREPFPVGQPVPSRSTVQRLARDAASTLGYSVSHLTSVLRTDRNRQLRLAFEAGLVPPSWLLRSPSTYEVDFLGRTGERYSLDIDLHGQLVSFRHEGGPAAPVASNTVDPEARAIARTLALQAYTAFWERQLPRGLQTDFAFRLTADGVPEPEGYLFEWTSQADPTGHIAWKLSFLVRSGAILRFDVSPIALSPLLEQERTIESTFLAIVISVVFLGLLACLYALALAVLNLHRGRLPWDFVYRVLALLGALHVLNLFAGDGLASFRLALHQGIPPAIGGRVGDLMILSLAVAAIAAGRATRVSADFRRWLGLEDFLRLRWNKASVTRSFLAAFLIAPIWLGVSYLLLNAFPDGFAESLSLPSVVIPWPALSGIYALRSLAVIVVVVFAIPWIRASVTNRNLQALLCTIAAMAGSLMAANVEFPMTALLLDALLHGLLLVYAYRRFGVLAALLGAILSAPLGRAFVLFDRGELNMQTWGVAMLVGGALFFAVTLFLDLRNPNREEEQRLSEEEFDALRRERERKLVTRRERLVGEFALAQQAQQRMLPHRPPAIHGLDVAAICVPAQQVGGDLFDYIHLADSRFAFCVADVSGKGVSAALYMTMVKGLLAASTETADLVSIASTLNQHLYRVMEKRSFVTLMLAALDPSSRRLEVLRAGHPPLLHARADGSVEFLASNGMGAGLMPSSTFQRRLSSAHVKLAVGDVAVLYSDGVTEAMNRHREEFGEDRLAAVVSSAVTESAIHIRDGILAAIAEFQAGTPAHDDITVVVLKSTQTAQYVRKPA